MLETDTVTARQLKRWQCNYESIRADNARTMRQGQALSESAIVAGVAGLAFLCGDVQVGMARREVRQALAAHLAIGVEDGTFGQGAVDSYLNRCWGKEEERT